MTSPTLFLLPFAHIIGKGEVKYNVFTMWHVKK